LDEFVEVLDLEMKTTTVGLTLNHTIRPHEGDALVEDGSGAFKLQFGPREVTVANEKRTLPGKLVTIQGAHVVEMTITKRLEPKVRPSAKLLADREKAELEALAKKHNLSPIT
jgi:hypothetical protein